MLSGRAAGEFWEDGAGSIIFQPGAVEPWRIGETLAECFLEDRQNAEFPYPASRNQKTGGEPGAGADLVGYSAGGTTSLFGEVKTSSELRYPPPAATGGKGTRWQLARLASSGCVRKRLIRWIAFNVLESGGDGLERCKAAFDSYAAKKKVTAAGVLIRDVPPDRRDIESVFSHTRGHTREGTKLDVLALYLPIPVSDLPRRTGLT